MSENVNGSDLFGSGGHVWTWGERRRTRKRLMTTAVAGEVSMVIGLGARPLTIQGRSAAPALLKTSGHASRALADAALDVLEAAIENLIDWGTECAWEDDCGRTGGMLVLEQYVPVRDRQYSRGSAGGTWTAWQYYRARGTELWGRP